MRSLARRTIVLAALLGTGMAWGGCSPKQQTEYVTGVSTQVQVPRDLKSIRIEISSGGAQQFCKGFRVYDGKVKLPGSLGSFAQTDAAITSGPITYTIIGVSNADVDSELFAGCLQSKVGDANVRILRRSRQPYIPEEIRFLPLPLKYSCYGKQCGEEETCKGGKCVSATLTEEQARTLFPKYTPELVDGTGGDCFSLDLCMGAASPAITVDPDNCVYSVANGKSVPPLADDKVNPIKPLPAGFPWEGTNVEITYDGGLNREILDFDPEEGFLFPDPAKPQQFKLAPGLCEMVKGVDDKGQPTAHRITSVRASGTCQPKRLTQPFCAKDQLKLMGVDEGGTASNAAPPDDCSAVELKPPSSALMIVVDKSARHGAFFNEAELKAVELPLKDPAFAQTDIGLVYATSSCDAASAPDYALTSSLTARTGVIGKFLEVASNPGTLDPAAPSHESALQRAYAALEALDAQKYPKRAVLVIGNNGLNADTCGAGNLPLDLVKDRYAKGISTYAIQLAKSDPSVPTVEADVLDPGIIALALAGSGIDPAAPAAPLAYNPDARGTKKNAKDSFQQVVNRLATCTYEVAGLDPTTLETLSFTHPLLGETTTIPAGNCASPDAPGVGWSATADGKRINLCADSCKAYQTVLAQTSDFALAFLKPTSAVPMFAHKKACGPK